MLRSEETTLAQESSQEVSMPRMSLGLEADVLALRLMVLLLLLLQVLLVFLQKPEAGKVWRG